MPPSPPTNAGYAAVEEGNRQEGQEVPEEEVEQKTLMAGRLGMGEWKGVEGGVEFLLGGQ